MDDLDENRFRLGDVLPNVGMKMRWDYDFGDGWEHDVLVEAISLPDRGTEYPVCLAGRRACPPEDCGGPWSYPDLLKALAGSYVDATPRQPGYGLFPAEMCAPSYDRGDGPFRLNSRTLTRRRGVARSMVRDSTLTATKPIDLATHHQEVEIRRHAGVANQNRESPKTTRSTRCRSNR